jgi:hypothetical protein
MTDHDYPPLHQMVEAMLMTVDEYGPDADTLTIHFEALRAALATRAQPFSPSTLEAAINCTEALAADRREPERYREWYAQAASDLRAAAAAGSAIPTCEGWETAEGWWCQVCEKHHDRPVAVAGSATLEETDGG